MSSSRSLRPWPRRCTTPHEDRGRPGPGRRRARRVHGEVPDDSSSQPVLFSLYEEEPGGRRPASLAEPPRPQERVQRHTVEHITDLVRVAPWCRSSMLLCRRWWTSCMTCSSSSTGLSAVPEAVIECPRSTPRTSLCALLCVLRSWQNSWWEVPTTVSYAALLLWQALHGSRQRTVEQNVDIPAVGGSGNWVEGLSGFLPGQSYSMTAEQIVDNPVPRRGFDEGLQGFPPGQSSATSRSRQLTFQFRTVAGMTFLLRTADFSNPPDTANLGVFRTFPRFKKSAKIPRTQ